MGVVRIGRHLEEAPCAFMISLKTSSAPIEQVARSHTSIDVALFSALHLGLQLRIFIPALIVVHRSIRDGLVCDSVEFDERLFSWGMELVLRYCSRAFRVPRRRFLRLWSAAPEAVAI